MDLKNQKITDPKKLTEALKKIKPRKILHANKHLGKVKWNEDAVEFQKRIRDVWD